MEAANEIVNNYWKLKKRKAQPDRPDEEVSKLLKKMKIDHANESLDQKEFVPGSK